jgi:eukaryotic-like serine/threonine-protein kinase
MASGTEQRVGRYVIYDRIASGGMASVHLGRLLGPAGFGRIVAIKRLHEQYAHDPEFVAMFLDEARLAARIRHPQVVSILDVVADDGELFLVMEYVQGESLSQLLRRSPMPPSVVVAVLVDALYGLHAAHEATSDRGGPLGIVHRDVSPQNILVGVDGNARVVDFGVAKATWRIHSTTDGRIKGKLAYMSPEQLRREHVDRRTDVFAAAVVLWQALAGRYLFATEDPGSTVANVLSKPLEPPSAHASGISAALDAVVLRGLDRDPEQRFHTAREMASALEASLSPASRAVVGDWVVDHASDLADRSRRITEIESSSPEVGKLLPKSRSDEKTELIGPEGVTDVSLATPARVKPGRDARWLVVFGLVALVAVAFGAFALGGVVRAPTAVPASAPLIPIASTPPAVTSATVAAVVPSASETPAAVKPKREVRTKPKRPGCDPPYRYDPVTKVKVYKEECF